ncbi:MAG: hypothetical protein ABEJ43_06055 [Haloferacaceae archaeon]
MVSVVWRDPSRETLRETSDRADVYGCAEEDRSRGVGRDAVTEDPSDGDAERVRRRSAPTRAAAESTAEACR